MCTSADLSLSVASSEVCGEHGAFLGADCPACFLYPYRWAWKGHDSPRQRCSLRRHGERCRVLVRGAMNSALVEFEDGFRTVTSRNGLRRADG